MIAVLIVLRTTDDEAIEDVTVTFKTEEGVFVADALSNADGEASLDLPAGVYLVRPFKAGVSFQTNTRIEVVDGEINTWDIAGVDTLVHPLAPDSLLCRVSGGWVDGTGASYGGVVSLDMGVIWPQVFRGQPVGRKAVVVSRARIVGGQPQAYMDFTLIQGGIYEILGIPSRTESLRVKIPSQRYCALSALLYPFPAEIAWGGVREIDLEVGEAVTRTITLTLTSGLVVPHAWRNPAGDYHRLTDWISIAADTPEIVQVDLDAATGELTLTGRARGTTTVTAELLPVHDDVHAPEAPPTFTQLTITVS